MSAFVKKNYQKSENLLPYFIVLICNNKRDALPLPFAKIDAVKLIKKNILLYVCHRLGQLLPRKPASLEERHWPTRSLGNASNF